MPGSQIPFLKNGDRSKATLDVIGQVKDAEGHGCRQHPRHGYDPARDKAAPGANQPGLTPKSPVGGIKVYTNIEFLLGGIKLFQTAPVEATSLTLPDRGAVAFQFDVPLTDLKAGTYICQVNVVDDAGGSFSFPRLVLRVTDAKTVAAVSMQSGARGKALLHFSEFESER